MLDNECEERVGGKSGIFRNGNVGSSMGVDLVSDEIQAEWNELKQRQVARAHSSTDHDDQWVQRCDAWLSSEATPFRRE